MEKILRFFTETILGNALWTLVVLGGGVVAVYFKGKGASWVNPLLYGLGAMALLIIITVGIVGTSYLTYASQRVRPQVTTDNIEAKVRDWLYTFGAGPERLPPSETPEAIFAMQATPKGSASPITILRPKDYPHYVVIRAIIRLGPKEKALREKLNARQIEELGLEVAQEMSRAKIGYKYLGTSESPFDGLHIERRVPITGDLTEDDFMQRFEEVYHDLAIANSTIVLALRVKAYANDKPLN